MEPNHQLPPSHLLLQHLAGLRNFDKDQKELPQLNAYRYSTDLKVQDQSKSTFQKWTSGEDWYNWATSQQPGIKNLPPLLDRAIIDLKNEFKQTLKSDYNLINTLVELEQAHDGLSHLREFENLDIPTQTIISNALEDIQKIQVWLKEKSTEALEVKLSNPQNFYEAPTGIYYHIPTKIAQKLETPEQKKKREAFEVATRLQDLYKSNESFNPEMAKNLEFLMASKYTSNDLKNFLECAMVKNYRAFEFNPVEKESKLQDLGFSEETSKEITSFIYKTVDFAATPETAKLVIALKKLSNNHFHPSIQDFKALNQFLGESIEINNQFHEFIKASEIYKELKNNKNASQLDRDLAWAHHLDEYAKLEKMLNEPTVPVAVRNIGKMFAPVDLLLSKFNHFVDPAYQDHFYSEQNKKMQSFLVQDISVPVGAIDLYNLFESYQEIKEPLNAYLNEEVPGFAQEALVRIISDSFEQYEKLQAPKILGQFKVDMIRRQKMLREDSFNEILDKTAVPSMEVDSENLVTFGYNALNELCQPFNEHNQSFMLLLQVATSQSSLNAAFSGTLGSLTETGAKYAFTDDKDTFNWLPKLSDKSREIKIKVIRDEESHDIQKIQVEVEGSVNIVEKKMSQTDENYVEPIVVKDAITAKLNYDLSYDANNKPLLDNFSLKYHLSLK